MTTKLQRRLAAYQDLIMRGVRPNVAFMQVFPGGTQEFEQMKKQAAEDLAQKEQTQGFQNMGVSALTNIGGQALTDALAGKPVFSQGGSLAGIGQLFGAGRSSGASGGGGFLGGINSLLGGGSGGGSSAASQGVASVADNGVQSLLNGGTRMADGSIVDGAGASGLLAQGSTLGNMAGGAGTLLGGYEAFEGVKHHNPIQAGLGGAGFAAGLAQLGYALPGWGTALAIGVPLAMSLFGNHKNTKQYQGERWNGLADKFGGMYGQAIEDTMNTAHGGSSGWNKESQAAAMRNPAAMWGQYGLLDTFGPEWFKFSDKERYAITQAAIENNLLKSDHGDILVTDAGKLRGLANAAKTNKDYLANYDAYKSGKPVSIPMAAPVQAPAQQGAPVPLSAQASMASPLNKMEQMKNLTGALGVDPRTSGSSGPMNPEMQELLKKQLNAMGAKIAGQSQGGLNPQMQAALQQAMGAVQR